MTAVSPRPSPSITQTKVDRRVFSDEEVYKQEMKILFQDGWTFVGLEAEIPNPGDFRRSWMGELPVIMSRARDGSVKVVENACSHRGALVALESKGNCSTFTCIYHQWVYGADGKLLGVPLRKNYTDGQHKDRGGLRAARVETFAGLVWATFGEVEPLIGYLAEAAPHLDAVLRGGEVEILGYHRYEVQGNWKLFFENTQDAYHASLLHNFSQALGIYTVGDNLVFENGHGAIKWDMVSLTDEIMERHLADKAFKMKDYKLFQSATQPGPGGFNRVMGVFPNALVLEEWDMLNVRHIVPKGVDRAELHTVALGLKGDSAEIRAKRARDYGNFFGPAGFAGRDDVVAVKAVQATEGVTSIDTSFMALGDLDAKSGDLEGEYTVRGFYGNYRERMGF
ncbi:SRPBCC family protein [Rhodococcus sp. IEGM 1307]|jgi:phenylpropionate dioxygenase-like ring-hydroxylating dioxygenase large terminal subunit|uniref:aromatic ring-hydroxylating oxygenase subunit alpha n=1 Tax=Rhodococcus sp. IEGM 1307 TaxID=3047091 RepID=UPI0024B7A988|nr:SRPBCC family protein [Rhodococcus sp. IEGM 1307]MDI9973352.1 SRPBCC family protein [Rhodococcus sp. IEGM 1307]